MRHTGDVAVKSGRVTMKMGKQGEGRWATMHQSPDGTRIMTWLPAILGDIGEKIVRILERPVKVTKEDLEDFINHMKESS